jgi:two-component system response regulator HydG
MKEGAYDFITKPVKRHAIVKTVRRALEKVSLVAENRALRARLTALSPGESGGLLGDAPAFREVIETLRLAAPTSATVLLTGESGTGKELAARLVHDLSPRAPGPFVPINCAAIPEGLLESELFGHERGAFTGAVARKEGRFERARGGTLFLDEVGEIPLSLQVKLLRFLQDGVLERVGGTESVRVEVRVVAATNTDLAAAVRAGRFREDLFYRLDVVSVRLPPLRERREDVPLLAMAFLRRLAEKNGKHVSAFTPAALGALEAYPWPGNVRELLHAVERAVILCRADTLDLTDLPESIRSQAGTERAPTGAPQGVPPQGTAPLGAPALVVPLGTTLDDIERLVIRETLRQTRGDKNLAAQILGIAPRTIYRKLDRDDEGRLVEPGSGGGEGD